jgi:hypothetical protein
MCSSGIGCRPFEEGIRVPLLAGTVHFLPVITPGMHGAQWLSQTGIQATRLTHSHFPD